MSRPKRTHGVPGISWKQPIGNGRVVASKFTNCIIAAPAIAGVVTLLTGTSARLDAGPLSEPTQTTLKTCTQRPWPYLNCVGTPLGNPRIRLVTTDLLTR